MNYNHEPTGVFLLIDNKSFYATVECTMRGLDPMTTPLVVMSEAANTGGGLVMAASPTAKRDFHVRNVFRQRNLPRDGRIIVVPPRMNLYINKNLAVNQIFAEYVGPKDLLPYSIDESILNITNTWHLFSNNILDVIRQIQHEVKSKLALITTVGVGNNPLQAKLALDIYAKHNREFVGVITNHTVEQKIWPIKNLTDVWGINQRMQARLNHLGIYSMYQLAHCDPFELHAALGVIGDQLYATAWGIDRTDLHSTILRRSRGVGNSQVLPRDYNDINEIELVIKEIGAQVASRLRAQGKQAAGIYLSIGYSIGVTDADGNTGFAHSLKLSDATAETQTINQQLIYLFEKYWDGHATVREIGVSCTRLVDRFGEQLSIFNDSNYNPFHLEETMDIIRRRFGKTSILRASSLQRGGTFIARSGLVGGHNGGNSLE